QPRSGTKPGSFTQTGLPPRRKCLIIGGESPLESAHGRASSGSARSRRRKIAPLVGKPALKWGETLAGTPRLHLTANFNALVPKRGSLAFTASFWLCMEAKGYIPVSAEEARRDTGEVPASGSGGEVCLSAAF